MAAGLVHERLAERLKFKHARTTSPIPFDANEVIQDAIRLVTQVQVGQVKLELSLARDVQPDTGSRPSSSKSW